ncbi:MAG TPA: ZIP family metal transporter [Rhodocyclaceae bacterium]|nr:ZIP family metal transporter [Rhodocyclaceae bacterium]
MSVLAWIVLMSFVGGAISVTAASGLAMSTRAGWIPMLVSYAIGALLGASFLEVLPHAIEAGTDAEQTCAIVLGGILLFFVLEKLVLWRHCHHEECEGHELVPVKPEPGKFRLAAPAPEKYAKPAVHSHDHGRSGMLIMVGDAFHNFVDGVLIAAAFMQDIRLGIITGIAIIAHEIPQEIGDFLILLHSGYTRTRAFMLNLFSSFATLAGGLFAYFGLSAVQGVIPVLLGLAASSMIYVAVADLIPGLHKRTELRATVQQISLIVLGIASIYITQHFAHHHGAG